jgi:hypothetical protein
MPKEQSLVPPDRTPYQIMDALDDDLIKAELENRIVETWVYTFFGSDGQPQSGLSKIGVDACCTEMAKHGNIIREGEVRFAQDPTDKEYILFQGIATRVVLGDDGKEFIYESVNGTKRQWTKMQLKNGKIVDDPFWYEKGTMKALRNARARLIPEETRTKIIAFAKQKGRIRPINGNGNENNTVSMTEKQRRKLWAMMKSAGLNNEEGKELFDFMNIETVNDASKAIEYFEQIKSDWIESKVKAESGYE